MKKIRRINVSRILQLSKNMRRITFVSNELYDFPENEEGGYIKFLFKESSPAFKDYLSRPYTIRNFRKHKLELDVDFSYHTGNQGYATKWAYNAKIGDEILISGPGSKQIINKNSKWFFFVGDMTAIPAIGAHLEELDENATGFVILEIISRDDKINLKKPKNIKISWVIQHNKTEKGKRLLDAVKEVKWIDENPYVWVACEFSEMHYLRNFFQKEKKICKKKMYISSYWKSGLTQEEHKTVKKEDSLKWGG